MQKIDSSNALFALASELVNHTSRDIFLTGKAGTGKTTFLKYIKENCPKQMAVVAPTGVAAINAGGVTIHSFFQLPFAPFVPGVKSFGQKDEMNNRNSLLSRLKLNRERRNVIEELELLVIDEVSMVRCDVLDAIDLVLRYVRHRHSERFGGVQVLFIGDMFQLPPVVKEQEWNLLRNYYTSPYFFDSLVLKEDPPVCIEFTKIYRQNEVRFIHLLNKVRNNEMDEESLSILDSRYQPNFFSEGSDGYILLTTHNEKAKAINSTELSKLTGKQFTYKAEIEKEFPSTAFPAEEVLQLKIGAQVMFIRNDADRDKRYFNGKIGVVTELSEEKIVVQCRDEASPIQVSKEKWENIRYTVDKSTRQLNEDVLGSFSQYPLRLAWAITIHKSQGLTFEKAVIDAGEAFAPGQVYVALSRCTNLEGMVLHSRIKPGLFYANDRIVQFSKNALPHDHLQEELQLAKKMYQQTVLSSLFDFGKELNALRLLKEYLLQHTSSFNTEVYSWFEELAGKLDALQSTAVKFRFQLKKLFASTANAKDNIELTDRLKSASSWFLNEIKWVLEFITQSPAITDSSMHAKEYNDSLREIYIHLAQRNFLLQGFNGKFNMENFHRRKKSFVAPFFNVNAYAGASETKVKLPHLALYHQLKKLRDDICSRKNIPIYYVAGSKTLDEMTICLPQSLGDLERINGFGKVKVDNYGNDFLDIIRTYCLEHNLSSNMAEKTKGSQRKERKEQKENTKAETFRLFKEGKTVQEISAERKLTVQTIEGHLAYYVKNGLVKIEQLVDAGKIDLILALVKQFSKPSVTLIKEKLGSKASYGEIRLVLAWVEYKFSSAHENH